MENNVFNPDEGIKQDAPKAESKPKKEKKAKPEKAPKAPKPQKPPKPYGVVAGYRALAIATLVLTIGGLFLGLLGDSIDWLAHTFYSSANANTMLNSLSNSLSFEVPNLLPGSLLNYAILYPLDTLANIADQFAGGDFFAILGGLIELLFLTGVFLLLIVAIVAAPICTLVAVCSRKRARSASIATAILSFLSYGLLFLWNFSIELLKNGWDGADIDLPVAIIAGCLFAGLVATAILRNKVRGGMMVASVCCTFALILGIVYPVSSASEAVSGSFLNIAADPFLYGVALGMHVWLFYHVIATLRRITAKQKYGYDIGRYVVMLILVLAFIVAVCMSGGDFDFSIPFESDLTNNLLSTLLLLIGSVAGLGVSITAKVLDNKEKAKEAAAAPQYDPYQQQQPQQNPYGYGYDQGYPYAPAYAPQPQYYNPAYVPVAVPVAPAAQPEPQREMTDFEREMLSIASKPEAAPAPAPAAQPTPVFVHKSQPAPKAQPEKSAYGDGSYTYDPFFTMLTNAEKDEFGDLFIAHKKGEFSDLPTYVIGGDNKEFFNKVWIRYSRYDMSPELREKIFSYVRSQKK